MIARTCLAYLRSLRSCDGTCWRRLRAPVHALALTWLCTCPDHSKEGAGQVRMHFPHLSSTCPPTCGRLMDLTWMHLTWHLTWYLTLI